jgi:hypothetical protein
LRVRLFPDDISVAAPLSAVTEDERVAGEGYWRARANSRAMPSDVALRNAYEVSRTTLATRSGAYRASYVAAATRPEDPDAPPGFIVFKLPAAPAEPPLARADLLPDPFVILTYSGGAKIHEGPNSSGFRPRLERFLIRQFRARHNVSDERVTVVVPAAGPAGASIVLFDFAASASGKHSLSGIQPLIARLRRLITRARAGDARDFWCNADMLLLDANDPGGLASDAYADLTNRLDNASSTLTTAIAAVKANLLVLAPLRVTLEAKPETVSDPAWGPALQNLLNALFNILLSAFRKPCLQMESPSAGC